MKSTETALLLLLMGAVFLFSACRPAPAVPDVQLPETPLLTQDVYWCGVQSLYARLYKTADQTAPVITLLRKGSLGRINEKKKDWYNIETPQYTGWVRAQDVREFDSSWQAFQSLSQGEEK